MKWTFGSRRWTGSKFVTWEAHNNVCEAIRDLELALEYRDHTDSQLLEAMIGQGQRSPRRTALANEIARRAAKKAGVAI
jgi:hypothetical protein